MKPFYQRVILSLISMLLFSGAAMAQPTNDNCANAALITSDSTCVTGTSRLTGQTLTGATDQGYTITSSCGMLSASRDVWYKFVAKTKYPVITISNPGTGWGGIGNVNIQLLTGSCGVASFTEVACATGATLTPALTNPLAEGTTYYIRIHKNTASTIGTNHTFDICVTEALTKASRMGEVFSRTVLSPASVLNYPWEITYGPDGNLWITEAQGYKMWKMDPNTGVKTKVLDLSSGSTFLPSPQDTLNAQSMGTWSPWPQGGFAGMAIHPNFLDGSGNFDFVYVAYVHRFIGGTSPTGLIYRNKIVRFTYNTGTGLLGSPTIIADDLPGSKDHNSQRMIIAPATPGGTKYLFYGSGDMGSGQFENRTRPNNAQTPSNYEGKILRFNLVTDGEAGALAFIPNTNPYSSTSAVYDIGIRNNQGFAYDTLTGILYGTSHGPYSDDELNIIQPKINYGHPLVIGYADGNYNGNVNPGTSTSYSAGAPWTDNNGASSCPPIGNETTRMNALIASAATLGAYKSPLFSAYPTPAATIANTWTTNPGNGGWYSEAWSGLDIYSNKIIPDWQRSLVAAGLKWGRLIRLRLGSAGITTLPSNTDSANVADTITYFQSTNRYRDLAFGPNGKDVYLIMDNSSATSGPGTGNPIVPACPGCVIKYSFAGYGDVGGFSTISKTIPISTGTAGGVTNGTTVIIDGTNNYLWVPITGPDGNIIAEINAAGQNLGTITSSFYKNSSACRLGGCVRYLDRNIKISSSNSFASPIKVRLYIAKSEYDALAAFPGSGVTAITDIRVLQNSDAPCGSIVASPTTLLTPTNTLVADLTQGTSGYVLQVNVSSLSSFYFAKNNIASAAPQMTWTGTTNSTWTTGTNWNCGSAPAATDDIIIPSGGTQPVLPSNITVRNVSLAGNLSLNGFTLTANGAITGAGTITGSATSGLTINGAAGTINFTQTTAATRSLNNLTLNSGASATLGTAVDVYGTIDLTSATLNLNGQNLTLKSDATNTARIDDLTGSTLSGATNVTTERYIKLRSGGTGRAYRLLAPTVNTTGSIKANWMEGGMNTAIGTNLNPVPNYGTQITGALGNTNGFDKTSANSPSLYYTTNGLTLGYTAVGSTTGTLNAKTGYFLYLRGDRSMNMTLPLATGMPTSFTTLRTTGTLLTGTQTSFTNAFVGGTGALNLVTNPYPSAIDWSLLYASCTNVKTAYTLWDPNVGTRGGFVTVTTAGTVSGGGTATKYIQPGQAFFVESNGGVPTVSIQENHKAVGNNNTVFRGAGAPESFSTSLYFTETDGYRREADGVTTVYDNSYSAALDDDDATEINNWDENIAIQRAGSHLAIESRPVIQQKDTLPLFMNNMRQMDYELQFAPSNFSNTTLKAELIDNFLANRTLLSVTDTVVVPFSVTADPASSASDRFMVVFAAAAPLPVTFTSIKAYQTAGAQGANVAVEWKVTSQVNIKQYEVERSTDGINFGKVSTQAATGSSGADITYNWLDMNPVTGDNFYRVRSVAVDGSMKYSATAKVRISKIDASITVHPNPVSGKVIGVQFAGMDKGNYSIRILNSMNQVVLKQTVTITGTNSDQSIPIGNMAKGNYYLEIIMPDKSKTVKPFIIADGK